MKRQTSAIIREMTADGKRVPLPEPVNIELEFSAIDTGGGFHDPILDFSFRLPVDNAGALEGQEVSVSMLLVDPTDGDNTLRLNYRGRLAIRSGNKLESMGRLKDEQVSRAIVKFIMRSLR
ncbi:hypothetical protein [Fodinibius sediminis]|nr:hypothetical protein [Fodinibius sediminis]